MLMKTAKRVQLGLWGNHVNLTPVEAKVARVLARHPETRGNDKALILHVWLEEDGLAEVLGEKAPDGFVRWFLDQATFPESITRVRRALQAQGAYLPDDETREARKAREQAYRAHFRHRR